LNAVVQHILTSRYEKFDFKPKQGKLFRALVLDGEALTASQIAKRFSIKNPTATISEIRHAGFPVYANARKAGNGVRVTEYRHGKASRKIVAAGYKAISMGLVD
jgi:hypothetical protein